MDLLESVVLNIILLVFPLLLCLLYQIYSKTLNKEKNDFVLDAALISSFYLIIQYGINSFETISLLILNIPIIVAYLKKRHLSILILSIFAISYYDRYLDFNIVFLIIEYIMYYVVFLYYSRDKLKEKEYLTIIILMKYICFYTQIYFITNKDLHIISSITTIVVFYIGTLLAVDLLKKMEDALTLHKTIKDLEEEKQIKESLFKITHEIKNPIAVCKGYLDMFDVNDIEHSRKYIPIMKEEIQSILILLKDFLSITKINIEKDIIDVNMLLEDVIKKFMPLLTEKKIEVITNIDDEELYLNADYNRLSQVFINVIKNSIESFDETKESKIEIRVYEKSKSIEVVIQDNGIGIPKDNLKKMNEPFFTTKQNGTGLGVYLSREIVKAHNGTMKYTSNEEGTKVTITLPL